MLTKLSKLHTVCVKNSIPNFSVSYRYQSSTATSHASHTSLDPKEINTFNQQAKTFWDPAGSSKVLQEMNSVRVPFIRQCLQTQPLNTAYLLKSQQAERLKNAALEEEEEEYDEYCLPLLGKNILDVGCGAGLLCEPLARLGANVVGIDASENIGSGSFLFDRCHLQVSL